MNSKILEICCYNAESVKAAANAGAHRVELCSPEFAGGGTPHEDVFTKAKKSSIKVFVMLHPREGDYCYDAKAFELLKKQVLRMKELGAEGMVFGILDKKNKIDISRNSELVQLCAPLETTLHKAFDEAPDPFEALDNACTCRFRRILTSGTKKTALQGKKILEELVRHSHGRIIIMAGGSIRSSNIHEFDSTGVNEFHSSALLNGNAVSSGPEIEKMLHHLQAYSAR